MAVERRFAGRLEAFSMLLAAICFAWGAVALWPFHGSVDGEGLRIVVLDSSASVSRTRSGLAGNSAVLLRAQAQAALAADQSMAVVTVSPQAQRRWGPADPTEFLDGEAQGRLRPLQWAAPLGEDLTTDWAGALHLLEGLAGAEHVASCQIVLYSDGRAADSGAWQSLGRLAALGCELVWGELPRETGVEVALVELQVPAEASPQAPSSARARMAWRGLTPSEGTLWPWRLVISDAGGVVHESEGTWPVESTSALGGWKSRSHVLGLPALPQGVYQVRVDLSGVPGDRSQENQWLEALLRVGEPLQVLICGSGGPGLESEQVALGLTAPGVVCQPVPAEDLGRWLPEAHLLVTLDLAPGELPAECLTQFVERGGSWLAMGEGAMLPGWSGRSVMAGGDLGALLPLTPDHGDGPAKDVILLVDGSGSMQGDPWVQVQNATLALLRNIPREVGFEVDLFTHDLLDAELRLPPLAGSESEDERWQTEVALRSFLQARVPGGKTNIMRSLESLIERRGGDRPAKVVLVTDGWQNDGGSWDPESLKTRLNAAGLELSIVATSENPNLSDLGLLLARERILLAGDLRGLSELLKQELVGDVIRRQPNMTVSQAGQGAGEAWALGDLLGEGTGPVGSFVKTKARTGTRTILQADRGEPILAGVPRGRGLVAQVTSLQGARFLWDGTVSMGQLVQSLAQVARTQRVAGPGIVAFDNRFFLEGTDGPVELQGRVGGTGAWTRIPLELALGAGGVDPRGWLQLDLGVLGTFERSALELRLIVQDRRSQILELPAMAPAELLPGGHVWPRELPEAVDAAAPMGSKPHPSGPLALVVGLVGVVAGLAFRFLAGG